jgi:hypothetical protein
MPRATAQLTADGTTTTYDGVLLYDILVKAGWQFGHGMTGKPMASYLIASGKDGYEVVFALPEIDPQFSGAKVIIADKADGTALPAREQPFRIVAPEDKMHARSIYSLVRLEVVRLRPYRRASSMIAAMMENDPSHRDRNQRQPRHRQR